MTPHKEHFTEYDVFRHLDSLIATATGLDQLPAWYLRLGAPVFAKHLARLFNRSVSDSIVPEQWKQAYIRPIQKISTPTGPADYRPISITPVLSRLLEKLVVKQYFYPAHLSPPPTLSFADQFAFRPGGSTTTALIALLRLITTMLRTNPYVVVITLDFSKALFDTVRHSAFAEKLASLDMPDCVYNWVIAFLSGHSHRIVLAGDESDFEFITASFIQGSGLGPASYNVAASDLHQVTEGNEMFKFADDTDLVIPARNIDSRAIEIQHVQTWASRNNLNLNCKKSYEIIFRKPRSRSRITEYVPELAGVTRVTTLKILGVTLTNNFSMADHVSDILASSGQSLYALRILRSNIDIYTERLSLKNLDSLESRRIKFDLLMYYKIINNLVDTDSSKFFTFVHHPFNTRGHGLKLTKKSYLTNALANTFANRCINCWNALPLSIVSLPTLAHFKMQLEKIDLSDYCMGGH